MQYRLRPADPMAASALARAVGVGTSVAQVLLHRGLCEAEAARDFLAPQLSSLTRPDAMVDRGLAAERLARAVRAGERIAVFGDYDVDGTTSAVILSGIIEALGGQVSVQVGNRWSGGYGLSDEALDRLLAEKPSLLVTCDCGSSDHERVERAMRAGVDVIVVDHHLVPEQRLPALAFLNPHRPECGFAYKGLASAGLVLSLGAAVRAALGSQLDLRSWLDLVALGTIADVAPLDGDNRRLVRAGLLRLAAEDARPGIVVLRELARMRGNAALSAVDVSFRLTPRLNAAGRMGDPAVTLELLRAKTIVQARQLGARIEQINDERKAMQKRVTEEAVAQVAQLYGAEPRHGIVVASESFHRGVVGITAARLVELFRVPVVVVAFDAGVGHGSARAPAGFPLYDALAACASELSRFGGHQAAAGVTLAQPRLPAFREAFTAAAAACSLAPQAAEAVVDVRLEPGVFDVPSAQDLARLEPLGQANAEPLFLLPQARVVTRNVVASAHLKLQLRVGSQSLTAFGYDMAQVAAAPGSEVAALGALRPDSWAGGERVELRLASLEPVLPG
ncbi:MAG TPA: single-stranded-DNA-specific exonuclease RecJ [Polyangiales bacterium]